MRSHIKSILVLMIMLGLGGSAFARYRPANFENLDTLDSNYFSKRAGSGAASTLSLNQREYKIINGFTIGDDDDSSYSPPAGRLDLSNAPEVTTIWIDASSGNFTCEIYGCDGSSGAGGSAGIYLPQGKTLIFRRVDSTANTVTLEVYGGNGGNGGNGCNGIWGNVSDNKGCGGDGGYGAGSGGAGIGMNGGKGGRGGYGCTSGDDGGVGETGVTGCSATAMGNLFVFDGITLQANAGKPGNAGTKGGQGGDSNSLVWNKGGGGGGGGGGRAFESAKIGGSGGSGAGGGGGKSSSKYGGGGGGGGGREGCGGGGGHGSGGSNREGLGGAAADTDGNGGAGGRGGDSDEPDKRRGGSGGSTHSGLLAVIVNGSSKTTQIDSGYTDYRFVVDSTGYNDAVAGYEQKFRVEDVMEEKSEQVWGGFEYLIKYRWPWRWERKWVKTGEKHFVQQGLLPTSGRLITLVTAYGTLSDNEKYTLAFRNKLADTPVVVPSALGRRFLGYYDEDTRVIDANGNVVGSPYESTIRLDAKWETLPAEAGVITMTVKEKETSADEWEEWWAHLDVNMPAYHTGEISWGLTFPMNASNICGVVDEKLASSNTAYKVALDALVLDSDSPGGRYVLSVTNVTTHVETGEQHTEVETHVFLVLRYDVPEYDAELKTLFANGLPLDIRRDTRNTANVVIRVDADGDGKYEASLPRSFSLSGEGCWLNGGFKDKEFTGTVKINFVSGDIWGVCAGSNLVGEVTHVLNKGSDAKVGAGGEKGW